MPSSRRSTSDATAGPAVAAETGGGRAPDAQRAIAKYRARAAGYDASAANTMDLRRRTVALLGLQPGETVLDVACGTGLSFELLAGAVGAQGRVIGVELSPEMAAQARRRIDARGWGRVELIEAPMESAHIDAPLDAVLFNYTHDVLRSPAALDNIFRHPRPGARVALAGIKHPPWWLFPARLWRLLKARPYVTTFEGLDRPWSLVAQRVRGLEVTPVMFGTNYIAHGRWTP